MYILISKKGIFKRMRNVERNRSLAIIVIIFFLAIGFVFYKYKLNNHYVKVNKKFENALVINEKISTDKTIDIEMAGKMTEGDGVKSCKNITELRGTILINNKKYELRGGRCSRSANNNFICIAKDDNSSCRNNYKCYISADLNSIVLESPNGSEAIVYPAQNLEEALGLKSKISGNK